MHFKKDIDQWRRVGYGDLKIGDVSSRETKPEEQINSHEISYRILQKWMGLSVSHVHVGQDKQ